jgi:hypothetical protein
MPEVYASVAETVWYTEDAAQPLTVLKPAAFGPGDMLLFVHFQDTSALSTLTASAGWTQEENPVDIANHRGKVWSHVYDGTEPSSWDFGYGSTDGCAGVLLRIEHADLASPVITVAVPTTTSSNAASMNSPSVTPAGNHDLLVTVLTNRGGGSAFSCVVPSGMTDLGSTQLLGAWEAIAVASEQLSSPGGTGTRTWTSISPTGQPAAALSIAVKDAGAFDPDPPRIPPLPTISEALLQALLAAKQRPLTGHSGTAWIQEKLSGGAVNATVTLTTAAGTKTGDVLYCFHGSDWATAAGLTTPTGTAGTWTLEATGDAGSNAPHLKLWSRVVTADGPQTVTVGPAVDEEVWSHLFVIAGADPTNPTDTAAGANGAASTAHIAPALTPTSPYPLLLTGVQGALGPATYTPPPGMDERTDFQVAGAGAGSTAAQILGATNTSTGTRTFTSTASQAYATVSVAIRAAGEPAAGANAPAEAAEGTGGAGDPAADIQANAEATDASGVASDATVSASGSTNAPAEAATATATAADTIAAVAATPAEAAATGAASAATVDLRANAENAAGTATADNAVAALAANAESTAATGLASDATVTTGGTSTNAPAEATAATGAALDAVAAIGAQPAEAAATASALDASTAITANAGATAATGAAFDPQVAAGILAGQAAATGAAADPSADVRANAEATTATGVASDATVSTSSDTSAPAESTAATGSAAAAAVAIGVSAEAAAATGAASTPAVAVTANAESAAASGSAANAQAAANAATDEAAATAAASDAVIVLAVNTEVATAVGAASAATVTVGGPGNAFAGAATGTGAAFDARTHRAIPRPGSGTIPRPLSATIPRPVNGVTARP